LRILAVDELMRQNWFSRIWSGWIVVGSIGVVVLLLGALLVMLFLYLAPAPQAQLPNPIFTVIPPPSTATPTPADIFLTPTPTPQPALSEGGIGIGVYVQITGTGGDGLRLRSGPGTSHAHQFIGMDEEVFAVKDGPVDSDGFTWWYLEAPYDVSRSGWAAGEYLSVVPSND
jgi:hypothetical protein